MKCEKVHTLLPEYAKGSLPPSLQGVLDEHLQQCQSCQKDFVVEMEMMVNLGSLPLVPCPDHVTNDILEEIEIAERLQKSSGRYWLWGASTLVAAALALIILMPSSHNSPSTEPFSTAEIRVAAREASFALAKVATVINHNENQAFEQVLGREIPDAVGESLRRITKNLQGEV